MHCECGKLVEPQFETIGKCEDCFADVCGHTTSAYEDRPKSGVISVEEALSLPISSLELGIKTTNCLSKIGIDFVRDLVKKTESELKNVRNLGNSSLSKIKNRLQTFALTLK
jgi:DNA-directed RNA polymerase alpha subunit